MTPDLPVAADREWIRKVTWFILQVLIPALKKKTVVLHYNEDGKVMLTSNITGKEIPGDQVNYLITKLCLRVRENDYELG